MVTSTETVCDAAKLALCWRAKCPPETLYQHKYRFLLAVPDCQYTSISDGGGTCVLAETAEQIPQCQLAEIITIRVRFEFSNVPASFQI
jgi:hypothetical protein